MLIDNLVSAALWWLFAGSTLWVLMDPKAHEDAVIRSYARRYGRLPSPFFVFVQTVLVILWWPPVARKWWERA